MYSTFRIVRFCFILATVQLVGQLTYAQDTLPPDHPIYTGPIHDLPEYHFDQEHIRLAIRFEQNTGQIYGTAKLRFSPKPGAPDSLLLDASSFDIYSMQIGLLDSLKQTATYSDSLNGKLIVYLDSLASQTNPIELQITYLAKPQTGLFFDNRSTSSDTKGVQIWTDGVLTNTSHWLPLIASQADLVTSEIIATVPPNVSVLSNGRLTERLTTEDGMILYHYVQDQPHSPKDIGFQTGLFQVDTTYTVLKNGFALPTYYWTSSGLTEDAKESLKEVPEMLAFFSDYLDFTYPWPSYSLMLLDDVHTRDMTFTGYSLLYDSIIKDEKARLDTMEPFRLGQLVARQWYSHLINADFDTDIWFIESISAYLSLLYIKSTHGDVPFYVHLHEWAHAYMNEAEVYQRPLVWNRWDHPSQLLDNHATGKGIWVFHTIHNLLGDEQFATFLQRLTKEHAFTVMNTDHILWLLSEFTKEKQDPFFDQWIYSAGHPKLEVDYKYDVVSESLYVSIDQVQTGYLVPTTYTIDLDLETYSLAGPESYTLSLKTPDQLVVLPATMRPRYVLPGSNHSYLTDLTVNQDVSSWITQLRYSSNPISQLNAVKALESYTDDPALLIGLQSALNSKPAAKVRAGIVKLIPKLPQSDATRQTLVETFEDESPIVQQAVLQALSEFENTSELTIIAMDAAQKSTSYEVQSEAVKILAKIQGSKAMGLIRSALITPSHNDIIRKKALESLFFIDMSTQDRLEIAREYISPSYSPEARLAAIHVLETLASFGNRRSRRILQNLLNDPVYLIKDALLDAFFKIGQNDDLEALKLFAEKEYDVRLSYKALQVISAIESSSNSGTSP